MKGLNLWAPGDLRLEELPIPACGEDEVLVKIRACGICGSDIDRILKKGTYHFPTVPGHEFAGEVVSDPTGEWTGKRVTVFPLLPCFSCDCCREGKYAQCKNYDYYGSRRDGGMEDYLAVKKFNLLELPENVSFEEAAMTEPISVALHAVNKLDPRAGETVLINGAGPIGLVAGEWAVSRGASVVFNEIDPLKVEFLKKRGASLFTPGQTVDCALEGTGAGPALAAAIDAVKPAGRIVLMGNPSRDVTLEAKVYQNILRKELRLLGTWNSSYSDKENDWKETLRAVSAGKIHPAELISHRIGYEKVLETLAAMRDRSEFFCKVMVIG